jgi:uncharacterized membrane protein
MSSKILKRNIMISVVIVLVLVGVLLLFRKNNDTGNLGSYFGFDNNAVDMGSNYQNDFESGVYEIKDNKYENQKYNFLINLPENSVATSIMEEGGEAILIKNEGYEMQIFVSAFADNNPITPARIKRDIPDLIMNNPLEVIIDGTVTTAFLSNETGINLRHIWFARGGFLYQVTAPAEADFLTGEIMKKWKWN